VGGNCCSSPIIIHFLARAHKGMLFSKGTWEASSKIRKSKGVSCQLVIEAVTSGVVNQIGK